MTPSTVKPMGRGDFRALERLRVRWAEIDAQRIVFNGHYLTYFDTAVAGYWRAMALPYAQTLAALGGDLFVRKATLDYAASARYDDLLDVGVRCARVGRSSVVFEGAVFRQDEPLVSCELVYVFADAAGRGSLPVPARLRDAFDAFEAGEAMTELQLGSWAELEAPAHAVRREVFIEEQGIANTLERDEADGDALHAVVVNRLGLPLATGRLAREAPGVGRIGRMAVGRTLRGSGVGRRMLDALIAAARDRGDVEVMLHAQIAAEGFYRRAGFMPRGSVFEEAGIAHLEMALDLRTLA